MAKLTDAQLIVLSKAAEREDGAAALPDRINKAAAAKVAASLVVRKLMREVRARNGMPVWRVDDDGRASAWSSRGRVATRSALRMRRARRSRRSKPAPRSVLPEG